MRWVSAVSDRDWECALELRGCGILVVRAGFAHREGKISASCRVTRVFMQMADLPNTRLLLRSSSTSCQTNMTISPPRRCCVPASSDTGPSNGATCGLVELWE